MKSLNSIDSVGATNMENSPVLEKIKENCDDDDKFYSPLCLTGYLTPLQRKKLREKRPLQSFDAFENKIDRKNNQPRGVKRKKEHCSKEKVQVKRTKSKEFISSIQCSAAKVVCKSHYNVVKNKKFFKASSPNRLERANFSMPFVLRKNLFSNIDKCVKESRFVSKKPYLLKEQCNYLLTPSFDSSENIEPTKTFGNTNNVVTENCEEKSLFEFDWPSDEVLLKRQEKARANIKQQIAEESKELKDLETKQNVVQPVKLYPIFYATSRKQSKSQDAKRKPKNNSKKMKECASGEQMIIDAGQREIGAKICSVCNMIYSIGLEEDEKIHLNYHNMYLINLKFPSWKEENVVGEYQDGRVIMIKQNDPSFKLKKIEDVLLIANRDLGISSSVLPAKPDLTFILFISNTRQVAGCVIAEPISCAYRVLQLDCEIPSQREGVWRMGNWYSSSDTVPAVCGINRMWVAHNYRRHKVASRMIDCLRCHFIHGHVIGIRELAFTDPSLDGREFAVSYTGTNHFLVYR